MLVQSSINGRSATGMSLYIKSNGHAIRRSVGALFGVLILVSFAAGAIAQESVSEQMKRMRRDLEDIQSYLYRSTNVPPANGGARSADSNPESAVRLQRQVLVMQTQMRKLTGQLERVNHDIQILGGRMDKLVGDVDLRLQALEGGANPAVSGTDNAGQPPQTVVRRDVQGTTIISSRAAAGKPLPAGSSLLGTVKQRDVDAVRRVQNPQSTVTAAPARSSGTVRLAPAPRPAPGPASVTVDSATRLASAPTILPDGTVQEQYTFAFKQLRKRDYVKAEATLRAFIERHPDVPLAGNAMYWMGETYYVRKDYAEAARIFLDAYQRFPKGNKAPDNLFKLGKSLAQIGEKQSACTTYAELVKSFPTANARILNSARNDMSRLECS